jgi:O-antigen/teichoic acid export membrane protein
MEDFSLDRLGHWAKKGGLAVLDQGLFSGANFLVNILLARWLAPEQYGAFAVALSIFYLLAGFDTAVLTEPMMVFGAGKYREQFRKYLGMLLWGHWAISTLIALGLGGAAWFFLRWGSPLGEALLGLALASPFLLLLWLTRQACYANLRPAWAVWGSVVNLVAVLVGLFLLRKAGHLSTLSGLVLLGAAAGTASLALMALHLRPRVWDFLGNPTSAMVFGDHWGYGSWNFMGVVAYWASGQILMLLIPLFLGLAASAAVAAVWNLYRPVSLFMQSLGLVLLPAFSRWVSDGMETHQLQRRATRFALLFGGAVALYGLVLTIGAKPILHLLYAGKYDEHSLLVALFGLSTAASMATGMFILALKAYGRTDVASEAWALSAVLVSLSSVPMMKAAGLEGAILSAMLAYSIACWRAYVRFHKAKNSANL